MIRMYARRALATQIAAGTDGVIFGMSLPSDSRINGINIELHANHVAALEIEQVTMFATEGWILPVLDPDAALNLNTLWDNLVPKDTDIETMDLDTGATDATPFYEPGEPDLTALFDVGLKPERIYHSNRMLTINNGSVFSFQDNQTPFNVRWVAGFKERIRIKRNFAVKNPSVLLFAVANPSLDDTTGTGPTALAEAEWGQVKYIGHVLERAMLHVLGVVEAGAETPWEEATALLKTHLEPNPFESNAGDFASAALQLTARGIVDHSVEGKLGTGQITTA